MMCPRCGAAGSEVIGGQAYDAMPARRRRRHCRGCRHRWYTVELPQAEIDALQGRIDRVRRILDAGWVLRFCYAGPDAGPDAAATDPAPVGPPAAEGHQTPPGPTPGGFVPPGTT
jgi:hypothetical protein